MTERNKGIALLIRDIVIRLGLDIVNVILNLIILTIVAGALSAKEYGMYAMVFTTASLLIPILLLRLNAACVRFFPSILQQPRSALRNVFVTIVLLASPVIFISCFAILALTPWSGEVIFAQQVEQSLLYGLVGFLCLRCFSTLFVDCFRAMNRSPVASLYNSSRFVVTLCFLSIQLLYDTTLLDILYAHILAELLILSVVTAHLCLTGALGMDFRFARDQITPYLRYSLPLVPYTFFIAVNQFADRYLIAHIVGIEEAGVYTFTYNLIAAAFLINTSIAYVIYPHISRLWHENAMDEIKRYLNLGVKFFLLFALPIAAGVSVVYQPVVQMMVGPEFIVSTEVVVYVAIGYIAFGLGSIFSYLIDLSKKTTLFLRILFIAACANICLNLLLIPSMGLAGAALATLITYCIQFLLIWRVSRNLISLNLSVDLRFAGCCVLGAACMLLVLQNLTPIEGMAELTVAILAGAFIYFGITGFLLRKDIVVARHMLQGR
ncbi:MAG: O-antigen/teichoic acid export membrane protein [Halieaceae bacterium]|jgi:O-antigen/teichoic acid export membrane protein